MGRYSLVLDSFGLPLSGVSFQPVQQCRALLQMGIHDDFLVEPVLAGVKNAVSGNLDIAVHSHRACDVGANRRMLLYPMHQGFNLFSANATGADLEEKIHCRRSG